MVAVTVVEHEEEDVDIPAMLTLPEREEMLELLYAIPLPVCEPTDLEFLYEALARSSGQQISAEGMGPLVATRIDGFLHYGPSEDVAVVARGMGPSILQVLIANKAQCRIAERTYARWRS